MSNLGLCKVGETHTMSLCRKVKAIEGQIAHVFVAVRPARRMELFHERLPHDREVVALVVLARRGQSFGQLLILANVVVNDASFDGSIAVHQAVALELVDDLAAQIAPKLEYHRDVDERNEIHVHTRHFLVQNVDGLLHISYEFARLRAILTMRLAEAAYVVGADQNRDNFPIVVEVNISGRVHSLDKFTSLVWQILCLLVANQSQKS